MLFTTIPTKFRESSSELFKDRGATGTVPGPVSESRVFALAVPSSGESCFFIDNLEKFVYTAAEVGNPVQYDNELDISNVKKFEAPIELPQIGVNFKQNNNREDIVNEMSIHGFSKVSSGKANYYLGHPSKTAMRKITQLGGDVDSFTAPQHSNIRGYMCFQFVAYILFNFCRIPLDVADYVSPLTTWTNDDDSDSDEEMTEGDKPKKPLRITTSFDGFEYSSFVSDSWDVPKNGLQGHFLPYFNGMSTPDRHALPRIMTTYFASYFATDAARTILFKGFASLASTSAGMQLTHLAFAIEKAIVLKTSARIFLTASGSFYSGVVIPTKLPLYKGNLKISASSAEVIGTELGEFDAHDTALAALCSLLSGVKTIEKALVTVKPIEITTPRQLHSILRERILDSDTAKLAMSHLIRLSFSQTFWSSTDVSAIQRAVIAIGNNSFLPDDCPIPYKSQVMFTKDIYTSTLAAFGDKVPLLSSKGETALIIAPKPEIMFTRPGTAKLPGFPIFETRLSQATDVWRDMFKYGVLHFACSEKGNMMHIKNVKALVSRDTDTGIALSRVLSQHVALRGQEKKEKKRARDMHDEEEEERIKKKREIKDKTAAERAFDDFFD